MKKISLSPEAMAALEKDSAVKFNKPLPDKALKIIRMIVAESVFGPTMKPKFKQQLLYFSSFIAIKSSWAADHFLKMMEKKYGTS